MEFHKIIMINIKYFDVERNVEVDSQFRRHIH